ncbi:MAG: MMPL family transporter [Candidatus Hydrogenedentes bacterium]|nr:MMPL family transporter [Candidatus Hydrogenedentota bacterium]
MKFGTWLTEKSVSHPRLIIGSTVLLTLAFLLAVALPTLFPDTIPLSPVRVDTDPENMLSSEEPARIFHNEMKDVFALNDMVVVGVVNNVHPEGVFNPESLHRIYELTEYAKTLHGEAIGVDDPQAGIVSIDIIAPSTVDNIEQGGLGEVKFEWLMPEPPETPEDAIAVREKASRIPFLDGTMVSESRKAIALYLPLTSKDLSYRVYSLLQDKIAEFEGDEEWHITGLPVANDTFGVEMFVQMAVSAPLAMLVIFLLMVYFFRKPVLIIAPMLLALFIVIINMGLLVVTGNTIHIMSSMIPIFLMPISILDSIHILSEFFDRYQQFKDRRKTVTHVMDALFMPMLYTSLTSAAGFASLAITPIPPVQVFGIFVAFGVLLAWFLTVTFLPAFIMLIPERSLAKFGNVQDDARKNDPNTSTLLGRILSRAGHFTFTKARYILAATVLVTAVAIYGMTQITVNDNPTRWFKSSHPIRVADRVLNEHFGGTYMAYLTLMPESDGEDMGSYVIAFEKRLNDRILQNDIPESLRPKMQVLAETLSDIAAAAPDIKTVLASLNTQIQEELDNALDTLMEADTASSEIAETQVEAWESLLLLVDLEGQRSELFKQPEALAYVAQLQQALAGTGSVGKSNSITDIVKTIYRELMEGDDEYFRVPDNARAAAQCLITYESSHRPHDLFHLVTPTYDKASIWVQLTSGNNQDMKAVVEAMDAYIAENPPPLGLTCKWFGLTYINVIWQEKMVGGMLQAFLGSFLVVLFMMSILFRSGLWGLLSMAPLTVTIGLIYGMVGLVGKDYDMPVAVLSSLTLGLAVDFAIHFLSRTRDIFEKEKSWKATYPLMFGEPARAITRNVVAVAIGFTPLLAAPLIPYNTVGVFMAAILGASGIATLFILPALIRYLEPLLFPANRACQLTCRCSTCVVTTAIGAAAVAVNIQQLVNATWSVLSLASMGAILIAVGFCYTMSRRQKCLGPLFENKPDNDDKQDL